jgi:hypothetical protein
VVLRRTDADWDALFTEQLPHVYNFFRYRVGIRADVEDLTSITFEKAWRARLATLSWYQPTTGPSQETGLRSKQVPEFSERSKPVYRRKKIDLFHSTKERQGPKIDAMIFGG